MILQEALNLEIEKTMILQEALNLEMEKTMILREDLNLGMELREEENDLNNKIDRAHLLDNCREQIAGLHAHLLDNCRKKIAGLHARYQHLLDNCREKIAGLHEQVTVLQTREQEETPASRVLLQSTCCPSIPRSARRSSVP